MVRKPLLSIICGFLFMLVVLSGCGGSLIKEISFNSNFGTPVETIQGLPGKKVTEPTPPTKEHYRFAGWFADREFTQPYVFDRLPNDYIILYAKWEGTIVETEEGLRLLLKDNGEYGVESYVGDNPSLIIPESYNDIAITSIEIFAFVNNNTIEEIEIPHSITLLRYGCFANIHKLKYILLPNSITQLEPEIFSRCTALRTIEFEEGWKCSQIGDHTFAFIDGLYRIKIPASVTSIGEGAFADCSFLRYIEFESNTNLTTIKKYAFTGTSLYFIFIPFSVVTIEDGAFNINNGALELNYTETMIYTHHATKPSGWSEEFFFGPVDVEWNSTRQLITLTYAKPDGEIFFSFPAASGTPIRLRYPDIDYGYIPDYYFDPELTNVFDLTHYPERSLTIYAKIVEYTP